LHGAFEGSVRIGDAQDQANGPAAKRFRTEIVVLRRFIAQPELCASHGEACDHSSIWSVDPKGLRRAEG